MSCGKESFSHDVVMCFGRRKIWQQEVFMSPKFWVGLMPSARQGSLGSAQLLSARHPPEMDPFDLTNV